MPTSQSLTLNTLIARNPNVTAAGLDKELAIMHLESNAYYTLNEMGTVIWQTLEQAMTVGALCEALVQRYDVSVEQCQAQVLKFLTRACAEGIVRCVAPGAE